MAVTARLIGRLGGGADVQKIAIPSDYYAPNEQIMTVTIPAGTTALVACPETDASSTWGIQIGSVTPYNAAVLTGGTYPLTARRISGSTSSESFSGHVYIVPLT